MIREANQEAVRRLVTSSPRLVDIRKAGDVLKDLDRTTILHAGPPITYERMCASMKQAVHAVIRYEGLAGTWEEARDLAASGKIRFAPNHSRGAVGPMTGITSYSMPLLVVKNETYGNYAYSTINEGAGDVIRFGACTENTIRRLKWIETVLAPRLKAAVDLLGGVDLSAVMSQALSMGDELHMRNIASSHVFVYRLCGALSQVCGGEELTQILRFLTNKNDQFFLNFAMAASKCAADAADGIPHSSIVSAMARNGVEIGIRVSGMPGRWFTAPAPLVEGLYFPGHSQADANPDIGDSAIMETGGFGAMAMAAAPAIVRLLGIPDTGQAYAFTEQMRQITDGEHKSYTIPGQNFAGCPVGIDILKVVETGIVPGLNTAIMSREPGVGMVGAGLSKVPFECFAKALIAFDETIPGHDPA